MAAMAEAEGAEVGDRLSGQKSTSPGGPSGRKGVASFGGGGAGLGGAVFVQEDGASLTFSGNLNISGGSALGGFSGAIGRLVPASMGAGVGSGISWMAGRNAGTFSLLAANAVQSVGDAIREA